MTTTPTRRQTLQIALAATAACALPRAFAQAPLPEAARIVVGFPPGGAPDFVARRMAEQLTGKLARAVIVENKPGAGGRIAVDSARALPPDGLTLLLNPAGVLTINPHSYKKLNYDPFKDFTPISAAATIDFGFAVGPGVPAEVKTLAEFTAWARTRKGQVNYGSPAAGAPPHFVGDAFSRAQGLELVHVPYRGSAPALNDLIGGQISALVVTLGDLVQHAKAGRLRLLASSGPVRSRFTPEVPTFAELGIKGLEMRDWFGVYIAGTATPEVQARTAALVQPVLASADYARALATSSLEAAFSTPKELDALARADLERWGPVVRASGFVADV